MTGPGPAETPAPSHRSDAANWAGKVDRLEVEEARRRTGDERLGAAPCRPGAGLREDVAKDFLDLGPLGHA